MNRVDKDERTQRIRTGLTGLAIVFLLVMLGAAITRSSEEHPPAPDNALATPAGPNDPLAEIGAAPATSPTNESTADNSVEAPTQ